MRHIASHVQWICDYLYNRAQADPSQRSWHDLFCGPLIVRDVYERDRDIVVLLEARAPAHAGDHEGVLDTGALVTMVDWYTSLAIFGNPRYWPQINERKPTRAETKKVAAQLGISRSLKVQVFEPIHVDQAILFECHILSDTPGSSCTLVRILDEDHRLLAVGTHDKIKIPKHRL